MLELLWAATRWYTSVGFAICLCFYITEIAQGLPVVRTLRMKHHLKIVCSLLFGWPLIFVMVRS